MISAKHMDATARILKTMVKPLLADGDYTDLVSEFADMFEENPLFDFARFEDACAAPYSTNNSLFVSFAELNLGEN